MESSFDQLISISFVILCFFLDESWEKFWILKNVFQRKPTENTGLIQTIDYSDEWVIVIQDQMRHFSTMSWRDQVTIRLDDDDVGFVLDQHTGLDLYNASSLKQQSACRHVAPLGHIIPIPNQSGFALTL